MITTLRDIFLYSIVLILCFGSVAAGVAFIGGLGFGAAMKLVGF